MLEEKILLFHTEYIDVNKSIDQACKRFGLTTIHVTPDEYGVPLGFLAYGNEQEKNEYHTMTDSKSDSIKRPMMVIAGLTDSRLEEFLRFLRSCQIPHISLKAILTEYNAEWNPLQLFQELEKEEQFFSQK